MDTNNKLDNIIESKIKEIYDDCLDGYNDPIDSYIRLYELEKVVSEYKKKLSNIAIQKRESYNEKEWIQNNYEVTIQNRKTWSYSNDLEYKRLKTLLKERENLMKKAYEFNLQNQIFSDENGLIVESATPSENKVITLRKKK